MRKGRGKTSPLSFFSTSHGGVCVCMPGGIRPAASLLHCVSCYRRDWRLHYPLPGTFPDWSITGKATSQAMPLLSRHPKHFPTPATTLLMLFLETFWAWKELLQNCQNIWILYADLHIFACKSAEGMIWRWLIHEHVRMHTYKFSCWVTVLHFKCYTRIPLSAFLACSASSWTVNSVGDTWHRLYLLGLRSILLSSFYFWPFAYGYRATCFSYSLLSTWHSFMPVILPHGFFFHCQSAVTDLCLFKENGCPNMALV